MESDVQQPDNQFTLKCKKRWHAMRLLIYRWSQVRVDCLEHGVWKETRVLPDQKGVLDQKDPQVHICYLGSISSDV